MTRSLRNARSAAIADTLTHITGSYLWIET